MASGFLPEVILDLARSETKRWGGAEPTLTHAAMVVARRWSAEFEKVFGEGGEASVEHLLEAKRFRGSQAELETILNQADDRLGVVQALYAQIKADLAQPTPAAQSETLPISAGSQVRSAEQGEAPEPTPDQASDPADLPERSLRVLRRVAPQDAPGLREREAKEAAAHLLRTQPVITALVGDPGVGRTSMLGRIAGLLDALPTPMPVWRLGPDTLVSNPASTLQMVLSDITVPMVVVLDDFDVLAELATDNPDRGLLRALKAARFHEHARLLVVLNRRFASRVGVHSQALEESIETVSVLELAPKDTAQIVRSASEALTNGRDVTISESALSAALAPAVPLDHAGHPGLALSRLDTACARAYLAGDKVVEVEHLGEAGPVTSVLADSDSLVQVLQMNVKGQPEAIRAVAKRLALTRANLDLRPGRPNGVFLFIGPSGVGKTQLARELAQAEYGDAGRLIRLDMSEYAHDWAISRLAGPAPGYVGSTEPESWLTTKVAAMPRCVVLLDEIEKAHPRVWNLFLQVFDAGRLTDGRGVTADFSNAVIVMTSNLGVQEVRTRVSGFGGVDAGLARERLLSVVRDRMAPELLNRMDEVIVFDALSMEAIIDIAEHELSTALRRLSAVGWAIDWDPEVPRWLAATGYDPQYGARHLQRNIEQEFLALLADATERKLRIVVKDEHLAVG